MRMTELDAKEPEDEDLKNIKVVLEDAEKKQRRLIERRNQLNDRSRELRDERDAINAEKRHMVDQMRELQKTRDESNAVAREHREKRNEYQRQAKALIDAKRKLATPQTRGSAGRIRELETEIKLLEHRQETEPTTIAKENKLIDEIKEKVKELEAARVTFAEQAKMLTDVKDVNGSIDEAFRLADEEHKLVVEWSNKAQAAHDAIKPILDQLRFLDEESDKKHHASIAAREEANKAHEEATKAREEVFGLREKRSGIFHERRAVIDEHMATVRAAVADPTKLEEKADEAVTLLLSKGKITLGPR